MHQQVETVFKVSMNISLRFALCCIVVRCVVLCCLVLCCVMLCLCCVMLCCICTACGHGLLLMNRIFC